MTIPAAEEQKIVAHIADGRILKGTSHDFFPHKEIFHLFLLNGKPGDKPLEVNVKALKALFFVKSYTGDKQYREKKDFALATFYGKKTVVTFIDGEVLYGFTQGYSPTRMGFFLFPADPKTNNSKVFVVSSAVRKVEVL